MSRTFPRYLTSYITEWKRSNKETWMPGIDDLKDDGPLDSIVREIMRLEAYIDDVKEHPHRYYNPQLTINRTRLRIDDLTEKYYFFHDITYR